MQDMHFKKIEGILEYLNPHVDSSWHTGANEYETEVKIPEGTEMTEVDESPIRWN